MYPTEQPVAKMGFFGPQVPLPRLHHWLAHSAPTRQGEYLYALSTVETLTLWHVRKVGSRWLRPAGGRLNVCVRARSQAEMIANFKGSVPPLSRPPRLRALLTAAAAAYMRAQTCARR